MADKKSEPSPEVNPKQEVDRIRDIIFGGQMREYEQQFGTFQRDLERLQQDLDRLNEQLTDQDSNQSKKLQGLRQEMRQADDDIRGELRQTRDQLMNDKVDRLTLGDLFIELGNHLKTGGSMSDLLQGLTDNIE